MTAGKILDFILANRGTKTFKDWTVSEIAAGIATGIEENTLLWLEKDNQVTGVILAEKFPAERVLFVTENLAMSLDNLKQFAAKAQQMYPGWNLEAMRHNQHRKFKTKRLYQLLSL